MKNLLRHFLTVIPAKAGTQTVSHKSGSAPIGRRPAVPIHVTPHRPRKSIPFVSQRDIDFFNDFDVFANFLNEECERELDPLGSSHFWRVQERGDPKLGEMDRHNPSGVSIGRTYDVLFSTDVVGRLEIGALSYTDFQEVRLWFRLEKPLNFELGSVRNFLFVLQTLAVNPDWYDSENAPAFGGASSWDREDSEISAVIQDILWDSVSNSRSDGGKDFCIRLKGCCRTFLNLSREMKVASK